MKGDDSMKKTMIKAPGSISSLSPGEKKTLSKLEASIERNLNAFYELGVALKQIKDARLYRETHPNFEAYCRDRWKFGRRSAYQFIDSAKVIENVRHSAQTEVLPSNERQTRALTHLPPDQQKKAWKKAVETAPGGRVTGKHVEAVAKEMSPDPKTAPVSPEYPFRTSEDFKKAFEHFVDEIKKAKASKWVTTERLAAIRCAKQLPPIIYAEE